MTLEDDSAGLHAQRAFTPEELVACERCSRANAPTRMNCLYCGAPLPRTAESVARLRPVLRKLEEWERGYNVVIVPRAWWAAAPEKLTEAASLLKLEVSYLGQCIATRRALPVARTGSAEEAELILERLGALGLAAEVFDDGALGMDEPPARVRVLEMTAEALVVWETREAAPETLPWPSVSLLVKGRVTRKRLEVEERQGVFKRRGEVVESRELASDEAVLDLYTSGSGARGWRLWADHLDYSRLGARKALTAGENFRTLAGELRGRASAAVFDEEYARLRPLLAAVWPPSEHNESHGVRRESVGRYNTGAVTTVTNETQFTRYTRLLNRLVAAGRAL
ncbi:MAG TPA: hypothetical protein VGX48_01060 [Pyrinomonadaceae bacterium]|nr:hypothetical protein [Pyrinomonadaceae bacterium]